MEPTPQEISEPQYLGEYEVLKSIGKGKFAVVYRARKIGSEQIVALKRISVDMMDEKTREKTLKEVRLLSSLDHPNIIRYIDSFIIKNDLLIVYEWAAAGDLKRQLRKAQERGVGFDERIVWKYFSQICDAMQHMHDKRIMHRDLKPANIFLTLDGTIKVGDLGLSRELSEHTIQAHSKVGTPLYMSPEVLKGEEGYDFKSDIWSLGCLLYELAMLKSPFKSEGLNMYSLFQKISAGDFQPLPDTYSETLRTLAYSMISTRPEDRPVIAQVCEVARRMRAETTEKHLRQRKATNNSNGNSDNSSKTNTEVAGVPSDGASAEYKGGDRPTSGLVSGAVMPVVNQVNAVDEYDFDIKPTTAARSSKERLTSASAWSRPASGGSGIEGTASTPPSAVGHGRLRRDDDHEQTADWKTVEGKREERTDGRNRASGFSSSVVDGHSNKVSQVAAIGHNDHFSFVEADNRATGLLRGDDGAPNHQAVEHLVTGSSAPAVAYKRPKSVASSTTRPPSHHSRPSSGANGRGSAAAVPVDSHFYEHFTQSSSAFALMEALHGMLVLLGYSATDDGFDNDEDDDDVGAAPNPPVARSSTSKQLLPFYFACDLQVFSSVAGQRPGTQFLQFRRMVCVAVWLVKQSFVVAAIDVVTQMDTRLDTPLTLAKQLVRAAQVRASLYPVASASACSRPFSYSHR